MRKFFEGLGIISLLICSFWYTEKTALVMKDNDEIMIQIKKTKEKEESNVTEAVVNQNTIIPGIHGTEIDINESYNKMKEIGYFDTSFFIQKDVKPKILLHQNYDKYIIKGNKKKNSISLLFLIDQNTPIKDVETILNILEKKNISVDFFVDGTFLENNNDLMYEIIQKRHYLQNLSYNRDYSDPSFLWLDAVLKKLNHEKSGFCYSEKKEQSILHICSMYKNHVIIPTHTLEKGEFLSLKKNLEAGNLIGIKINASILEELPMMIDYIKAKGYKIKNLKEHLEE